MFFFVCVFIVACGAPLRTFIICFKSVCARYLARVHEKRKREICVSLLSLELALAHRSELLSLGDVSMELMVPHGGETPLLPVDVRQRSADERPGRCDRVRWRQIDGKRSARDSSNFSALHQR